MPAIADEFDAEENYKQDIFQQNLTSMDLWNNAKGRELGRTFKKNHWYGDYDEELSWKIVSLITEGSLWVIDWRN